MLMIYLDKASTTQVSKKVLKEYVEGMVTIFYAQRKDNNNE